MLISPEELRLPGYMFSEVLDKHGMSYEETTDLVSAIPELDVLYMTRVQGERFADQEQYLRLRDTYILTPDKLETAKKDMCILHPLPRVNEISIAIDDDPRACYFKQVMGGKLMRMALILKLLEDAKQNITVARPVATIMPDKTCKNRRCICHTEQELPQSFVQSENGTWRCYWCDTQAE